MIQSALLAVPKSGEVWNEAGCFEMQTNPAKALDFFKKGIEFTPQYGDLFINHMICEKLLTGKINIESFRSIFATQSFLQFGVQWRYYQKDLDESPIKTLNRIKFKMEEGSFFPFNEVSIKK